MCFSNHFSWLTKTETKHSFFNSLFTKTKSNYVKPCSMFNLCASVTYCSTMHHVCRFEIAVFTMCLKTSNVALVEINLGVAVDNKSQRFTTEAMLAELCLCPQQQRAHAHGVLHHRWSPAAHRTTVHSAPSQLTPGSTVN